jgi:hypothetical protein
MNSGGTITMSSKPGSWEMKEKARLNKETIIEAENEVKRLRGNIVLLIQKWSFHSPHTRDTLKAKDVLAALQDALVSENYYAGEED